MDKLRITGPDGLVVVVSHDEEGYGLVLAGSPELHQLGEDTEVIEIRKVPHGEVGSLGAGWTFELFKES